MPSGFKKFSQITPAPTPFTTGDQLLGVRGGTTDLLFAAGSSGGFRIKLTADTTYYVATTGSDVTGDGSVGNPWATLQHAIDVIQASVDLGIYQPIVNLGAGSFFGQISTYIGGNYGNFFIVGAGSASTTVSIWGAYTSNITLQSVSVDPAAGGSFGAGLVVGEHAEVVIDTDVKFIGTTTDIYLYDYGAVSLNASYTISGNKAYHVFCDPSNHSRINNLGGLHGITLVGAPVFSGAFFYLQDHASFALSSGFSILAGTATGPKFIIVGANADITGAIANIPGDVAGTYQKDVGTAQFTIERLTIADIANPAASTLTLTGGTALTTSQPALNITQGWNNAGAVFTAIKLNVTDTLNAAGSKLVDLQTSSASVFSIRNDGSPNVVGGTNISYMYSGHNIAFLVDPGGAQPINYFLGGAGNFTLTGYANFGEGTNALSALTTGYANLAMGVNCLPVVTIGHDNVAMGYAAMLINVSGNSNTALGSSAMDHCVSGSNNVALGNGALRNLADTDSNMAIGTSALRDGVHIFQNTAIGTNAGAALSGVASGNVFVGYNSGGNCTVADVPYNSVFIGAAAGYNMANGNNVAVGYQALFGSATPANNTGFANVAIGQQALLNITSGPGNVSIGPGSMPSATTADSCVCIGNSTGGTIVSANGAICIGNSADVLSSSANNQISIANRLFYDGANLWEMRNGGNAQTLRIYNTFTNSTSYERGIFDWNATANWLRIGTEKGGSGGSVRKLVLSIAGNNIFHIANIGAGNGSSTYIGQYTSGITQDSGNGGNVALGYFSMPQITTGDSNLAIGSTALFNLFTASNCIAIGYAALNQHETAAGSYNDNVAVGGNAGINVTHGNLGTLVGSNAGGTTLTNITGNTLIGASCGDTLTTGTLNLCLGYKAGKGITTGTGNIVLGTNPSLASGLTNNFVVAPGNSAAIVMQYDGANFWDIFNATNPQTLRVYNTFTNSTSYERGIFDWNSAANVLTIGTEKGSGGGTGRNMQFIIDGVGKLDYGVTNANVWTNSGSLYVSGDLRLNNGVSLYWQTRSVFQSAADGNIQLTNNAQTDFGLLQLGGSTASFPALKRSTTKLIVRLADDSADTEIQAQDFIATGDIGSGTASTNKFTNANSTTISTGVGSVKMSTANPGTNTGWLKCYIGTQVAWIPCWTTNAP